MRLIDCDLYSNYRYKYNIVVNECKMKLKVYVLICMYTELMKCQIKVHQNIADVGKTHIYTIYTLTPGGTHPSYIRIH